MTGPATAPGRWKGTRKFPVLSLHKVTDGDTYWAYVDMGLRQIALIEIRLDGFDTPERTKGTTFERKQAVVASDLAKSWWLRFMADGTAAEVWVETEPDPERYGRWLGKVYAEFLDGTRRYLGDALREQSLASIWPTRWRDEYDRPTP